MKKYIIGQKGSTLVILLLTTSVILIIGTAALYLSSINYKMKVSNSQVKKAFYYAEAGIDEAYVKTIEFVNEAINYAEDKVNDNIEDNDFHIIYNCSFKNYIKGKCDDNSSNKGLISALNDNTSYLIFNEGYPKISAKLKEHEKNFDVEINSVYVKDKIKKEIVMKCVINIPEVSRNNTNEKAKEGEIINIVYWKVER